MDKEGEGFQGFVRGSGLGNNRLIHPGVCTAATIFAGQGNNVIDWEL
jgi:hypothetical protein